MITDIILLFFLFGLIGAIVLLISYISPPTASKPNSNSAVKGTSSALHLGKNTSLDWNDSEIKFKTSHRPVTQQDLLESAERHGKNGGKFVVQHAESFRFGNKDFSA